MSDATEITNENWRENTLPMTICGPSGGGKTTTARCLHDTFPGTSIFFNLDHEPDMGEVVESVEGLADALRRGVERIDVRPPATAVEEPDLFPETIQFLMELGNELRGTDALMQVLIDEAHDLQAKWTAVAMKRFRKRRIKPVVLSQDPVSLPKRLRTIAAFNCWLSGVPEGMDDTLTQLGYPVELLQQLPAYDMLVMGEGWEAVDRFRAPERYAR